MPTIGTNHNGGYVYIGNDGFLYASVGDGGGNGGGTRAPNLSFPNGKIHRIDRNTGAPVAGNISGTIFAMGLRNPFRLAFKVDDPNTKFRIDDVGETTWEEIDDGGPNNLSVTVGGTSSPSPCDVYQVQPVGGKS